MVLRFKIFLSLSDITHLFPFYVRISSTILKFLQGFRKVAVFPLVLTKSSIFLLSACLLLAIFLKFFFNQKEKRGFIWSKTFDFLFQEPSYYYSEKKLFLESSCSWISKTYEEITFNFCKDFWKINMNMNFFACIFVYFFCTF